MKGPTPAVLTEWWAANQATPPPPWEQLQNPQKLAVLVALLQEQNQVCIYCGKAITPDPVVSHIEHFWPQSKFQSRRFDWTNLFASCGPSGKKNVSKICGDAKASWTPANHIEPTDPQCEQKFSYDGNGAILPSAIGGAPAETMIGKLNLIDSSLNYDRFLIVAELEDRIAGGDINAANKLAEVNIWRSVNASGKAIGYGHVAARYLEDQAL